MIRIQVRKLWGQVCTGPSVVFDQSNSLMRWPISPPPDRNSGIVRVLSPGVKASIPVNYDFSFNVFPRPSGNAPLQPFQERTSLPALPVAKEIPPTAPT